MENDPSELRLNVALRDFELLSKSIEAAKKEAIPDVRRQVAAQLTEAKNQQQKLRRLLAHWGIVVGALENIEAVLETLAAAEFAATTAKQA